ncbi:MAG: hypothetical protein ACRC92_26805 [Peptostreptococcaceae bacterium]
MDVKEFLSNYENCLMKGVVPSRLFRVSAHHGADVVGLIERIKESTNRTVVIGSAGEDVTRQLKFHNIEHTPIIGEMFLINNIDGNYQYIINKAYSNECVLVLWCVNHIPHEILDYMIKIHGGAVIIIGDNYVVDYMGGGKTNKLLMDSDLVIDSTDRVAGYSQELIFLANRIRKGVLSKFHEQTHRAYSFSNKFSKDDMIKMSTEYDVFIANKNSVGDYTRSIRDSMGYGIIPEIGECIVFYEPYRFPNPNATFEDDDQFVEISIGQTGTIRSLCQDFVNRGYVTAGIELESGITIQVPISLAFLCDMQEYTHDNPNVGAKVFYTYVLPPYLVVDKSFDRVLLEYKPLYTSNKKVLYSMVKTARKNICIMYTEAYLF